MFKVGPKIYTNRLALLTHGWWVETWDSSLFSRLNLSRVGYPLDFVFLCLWGSCRVLGSNYWATVPQCGDTLSLQFASTSILFSECRAMEEVNWIFKLGCWGFGTGKTGKMKMKMKMRLFDGDMSVWQSRK